MKRFLMLCATGLFSAALVGCAASGEVDRPRTTNDDTSYKKTTTYNRDGDKVNETTVKKRE